MGASSIKKEKININIINDKYSENNAAPSIINNNKDNLEKIKKDKKNINNQKKINIDLYAGGNINSENYYSKPSITKKGNININFGGNRRDENDSGSSNITKGNNKDEEYITPSYAKPRNIDNNLGGNKEVGIDNTPSYATPGNIDNNVGGNKREGLDNTPSNKSKGNIDNNVGGNRRNEKYITPINKSKGNIDNNLGGNKRVRQDQNPYLNNTPNIYIYESNENVLVISGNFIFNGSIDSKKAEELAKKRIAEGYFPLFMQLNENKILYFFAKTNQTIENILEKYKFITSINDNKKYILYNKKEGKEEIIPQDKPLEDLEKDLGFKKFSFITN